MPTAHEIDYAIKGHEMQFVEIELDPGESAVSEAGSLMYKDPSIEMSTMFGDGSGQSGGFMDLLVGAGKRVLSGESLFTTVFTHRGSGKAHVAFAAPYPGTILALDLVAVRRQARSARRIRSSRPRKACRSASHSRSECSRASSAGKASSCRSSKATASCSCTRAARSSSASSKPAKSCTSTRAASWRSRRPSTTTSSSVGGVKSMIFGGEGVFFARLRGPGHVWLQSLPFSRLAGRIMANLTPMGRRTDEGSLLGAFGNIIQGK